MDTEPAVIRQEIDETRQSLTEKLETLENQVMGTVKHARETVQDTIDTVKTTVTDTVDSVKQTFDVEYQVKQHPFVCAGLSFAAGVMAGALVKGSRHPRSSRNGISTSSHLGRTGSLLGGDAEKVISYDWVPESAAAYPSRSEPKNKPSSLLSNELDKVKALALGTIFGLVRDLAKESLPQPLAPHIDEILDSATVKLGGQPLGNLIH
jgi:ElaB/YqjD/DUF883 family membrane-anchored ribosome-binding protein